jgi:hypothetical protein
MAVPARGSGVRVRIDHDLIVVRLFCGQFYFADPDFAVITRRLLQVQREGLALALYGFGVVDYGIMKELGKHLRFTVPQDSRG